MVGSRNIDQQAYALTGLYRERTPGSASQHGEVEDNSSCSIGLPRQRNRKLHGDPAIAASVHAVSFPSETPTGRSEVYLTQTPLTKSHLALCRLRRSLTVR